MCKLLPHTGGRSQTIAHRVRPKSINDPSYTGMRVNEEEKACAGIYHAQVTYTEPLDGMWTFG